LSIRNLLNALTRWIPDMEGIYWVKITLKNENLRSKAYFCRGME